MSAINPDSAHFFSTPFFTYLRIYRAFVTGVENLKDYTGLTRWALESWRAYAITELQCCPVGMGSCSAGLLFLFCLLQCWGLAFHMLGKSSIAELYPSPADFFSEKLNLCISVKILAMIKVFHKFRSSTKTSISISLFQKARNPSKTTRIVSKGLRCQSE